MRASSPIVILGGTSLVALYLVRRLDRLGRPSLVAARRPVALPAGFGRMTFDDLRRRGALPSGSTVVSLLPLAALTALLQHLGDARAIVALGSTSLFSKAASADASERAFAETLATAEATVRRRCAATGTHLTLLRPTLVYDFANDRNIARIARFIRRFGILPVAAPASGLRQPIHADDIARAILAAVDSPAAFDRSFNIAGGEQLSYRAMATRVFEALGRRPRFLMLPAGLLAGAFSAAAAVGLVRETGFGGTVFQRMNEDLVFDVAEGLRILDYDPRPFDLPPRPRPGDLDHRDLV